MTYCTTYIAREIAVYDGSVSLYLADKSQHLRVPERVFFHLVENHDDDEYPFAFLATYSTRIRGRKIVHKPLHYAMTEYKGDRDKLMILLSKEGAVLWSGVGLLPTIRAWQERCQQQ